MEMKPQKSNKLPRMSSETDSIMVSVRYEPYQQPVPVRRSFKIDIPASNAFDPYPSPTSFSTNLCQRIDVLHPEPYDRRTVALETEDQHAFNNFNKTEKERQMRERFHNAYSRYYYGDPINKEIYRKYIRESLKQQMVERELTKSKIVQESWKESAEAARRDQNDIERERTEYQIRSQYMRQFRDSNKLLMDESKKRQKDEVMREKMRDRDLLRYNPINWSATLK